MGLGQDLKFGLRILAKSPGFALVAILTLALGIGANSTIFTLVNGVFLRGLPFEDPNEIVTLGTILPLRAEQRGRISYLDFLEYRERSRSFKGLGAFTGVGMDLSDPENAPERVSGASITVNTFSLLGQGPLKGRDFIPDDEEPGANPVTLLSYGLWQSPYGGDPSVVGREVRINLKYHTVVGIMPDGEGFPEGTQAWIPLLDRSDDPRDQRDISVFGRLRSTVDMQQAIAEVNTIGESLSGAYPDTNKDIDATVYPFIDVGPEFLAIFAALQGAVGFVLLIACANVANLLLSRAVGRMRETSIRAALGASRSRVVRQLLIESLVMSFLGGILGLGIAVLGVRLFWNAVSDTVPPYWLHFAMDYRVFGFFLAVSAATGILCGLAPALQISKANINDYLKEGSQRAGSGVRTRRLAGGLLIGQIALALVLLIGAGLMTRTFVNIQRIDFGIETSDVLTARLTLREEKYPEPEDRLAFEQRLQTRLEAMAGIDTLTIASHAPAAGTLRGDISFEDQELNDPEGRPTSVWRLAIAPGYFDALGIAMLGGRDFDGVDGGPGAEVVIVNAPFAARYWPGKNAIGQRIRLGEDAGSPWLSVVGVSPNVFQASSTPAVTDEPTVYVPYRQEPVPSISVIAVSQIPAQTIATSMREELRSLDPDLPLFNFSTMDNTIYQRTWFFRVFGGLFTIFALVALAMSSVGVYGVTAYAVGQRTSEIGIRRALGASKLNIVWLVLGQGLRRIVIGLMIGLVGAWGLSRVLGNLLFGVTPTDPLTYGLVLFVLVAVSAAACFLPARRAMLLNPSDALRTE